MEEGHRRDVLGEGPELVVRCTDTERELDLGLRVTLLEQRPALVLEATARNVSTKPLILGSLQPLGAMPEEDGARHWPDTTKLLTNGAMYSDPMV